MSETGNYEFNPPPTAADGLGLRGNDLMKTFSQALRYRVEQADRQTEAMEAGEEPGLQKAIGEFSKLLPENWSANEKGKITALFSLHFEAMLDTIEWNNRVVNRQVQELLGEAQEDAV